MSNEVAVKATLNIELNITCPHCEHRFDLVSDTNINDEGWLFDQVISDDRWYVDADERLECDTTCPECGGDIVVKGVIW